MDYKKLGLIVGLEIHQQLDSGHKLFCRCSIRKEEQFPHQTTRKLRAVPSELGDFDPAVLQEYLRDKMFVYKFNTDSCCLVELDEDPPKSLNEKALHTALQLCKMIDSDVLDEIYVMRKTVIDGSSVSGFQRTALVCTGGHIETSFGKVGIQTVGLEEDSAPALSKKEDTVEYRLDRLGTPLVEIATAPDMHTPEQARETAEKLGTMLRSLDVVRGIGSIRQDINISITNGERIEIKGFQELDKIPELIENEVKRQICLLEIRDELRKRSIDRSDEVKTEPKDVTNIFKSTKCTFIRKAIDDNAKVFVLVLPKFVDLFKKQCGDRTFGKEFSSYAEQFGLGIIHSDEDLEKYKLTSEFAALRKHMNADERDLILITAASGNKLKAVDKALNALSDRAIHCLHGVPKETRVADGIGSKYTRPLPGSGRMYPETDIKPVRITKEFLDLILVPESLEERRDNLEKELSKEMAGQMVKSKYYKLYEKFKKIDPKFVASVLLSTFKDLKRQGFDVNSINEAELEKLFELIATNYIPKTKLNDALIDLTQGKTTDDIRTKYKSISDDELKAIIKTIIDQHPGKKESVLMGIVMKEIKGRADGKKIMQILREKIKE